MDTSFLLINVVITFVETRIKGRINYEELVLTTGFSLSYIRELFVRKMHKSLYRYILERRIANAAFECRHTNKTLLSIGLTYGFNSADSFTRAFKRIVGLTPSEFRKMKITIKRIKLCAGVYGIELPVYNKVKV